MQDRGASAMVIDEVVEAAEHPSMEIFRAAIARRTCVTTVYNRAAVTLAPHILYLKHGDPFIDGVVVERDGKKPRELKIGAFKVAGLGEAMATKRLFAPLPSFDSADPKYGDALLCVAQRKSA